MIQISTDYVFDGTNHTPYTEDEDTCPNSVYGRTKLVGELNVQKLCERSMIIRTAWLYSTFGNNFVKTMIRLGREKAELGVIFDQIGTPTYARDLAVCIMTAIRQGVIPGIYHFSNEGVTSWYDFTKAIHRLAAITTCHVRPLHTAEYPTPAARPHYSVLDKTKIKQTFGIEVPYWEDSLAECVRQLLAPPC
jgi:dTDP-4-dehydrorhamnose reductase